MRMVPDSLSRNSDPVPFDNLRHSYNGRYTIPQKNLNDILSKINISVNPDSTWLRNILSIIKVGDIDYALITRLLRMFMVRPTLKCADAPKLLEIISQTVNSITFV